jgi:hypothetical protein
MGRGKRGGLQPVRLKRMVCQLLSRSQHLRVLARQRGFADTLATVGQRQLDKQPVGLARNPGDMQRKVMGLVVVHKWPLGRDQKVTFFWLVVV